MHRIVVVGGGVCGTLTAMLLAKDGHEVTVLERDPAPPPADPETAWAGWERNGVNQFRQLHYFNARFRQELDGALPEVVAALDQMGALRLNPIDAIPETVRGPLRPDDDRFECLTARRPVVEAAVALAAQATTGLTLRRGVAVDGLIAAEPNGAVPHVQGVRTADGEEILADLVIDAAGRRSPLKRFLAEIGAGPIAEEVEDCGFVYYGRHFRSPDGSLPFAFGGALQPYDSLSILSLAADHGTWGLGLVVSGNDKAMRKLRDPETWTRVVSSYPLVAHWLEGEPMDDVAVMAGIPDRRLELAVDGAPAATGVVTVADAWASTNPSLGRGAAIGLIHAVALRDHLRDMGFDDPAGFAKTWSEQTAVTAGPYVDDTLAFDRHRLAEIEAEMAERPYETDDPGFHLGSALRRAAPMDADLLRGYVEVAMILERGVDVLSRPGLAQRAIDLAAGAEAAPGPTRRELLALVGD